MARRTGLGRAPSRATSAEDVVAILGWLAEADVDVWLHGGWGVDALLSMQTRPHDDLDLIVELRRVGALQAALRNRGYEVAGGGVPRSLELVDDLGRQVDVHPVVLTETGDGVYTLLDGGTWIYPAAGFGGTGDVLGRRVRCLTPEVQLVCHTGYKAHRTSFEDVTALAKRFGLEVPDEYRGAPDTYPQRTE